MQYSINCYNINALLCTMPYIELLFTVITCNAVQNFFQGLDQGQGLFRYNIICFISFILEAPCGGDGGCGGSGGGQGEPKNKQKYVVLHSKSFNWKQNPNIPGLRATKKLPDPYWGIFPDLGQDLRNIRDQCHLKNYPRLSTEESDTELSSGSVAAYTRKFTQS